VAESHNCVKIQITHNCAQETLVVPMNILNSAISAIG